MQEQPAAVEINHLFFLEAVNSLVVKVCFYYLLLNVSLYPQINHNHIAGTAG